MAKDAITMFKEAAVQLQKEEIYLALDHTRKANDEDEALQEIIGEFNLSRIDLNSELSKGDEKSTEKVAELNKKVNELYSQIMENENMAAYNEAKQELEAAAAYINAILSAAVNGEDPMLVQEPQAGGCSGSCSSCSGCH